MGCYFAALIELSQSFLGKNQCNGSNPISRLGLLKTKSYMAKAPWELRVAEVMLKLDLCFGRMYMAAATR